MKVFCTLFDSNYLSRGLACYESLASHTSDFLLYVFAFDDLSFHILTKMKLPNLKVIGLHEFEEEALLKVKPTRSKVEYCWTCTPSVIDYVFKKYGHDNCTYIDADLYFYKDPSILFEAMGDNSVLITPHYYSPEYDQTATSGIFCVQFVTFKNDEAGREVLSWWRNACLDWCYDRMEDGKFGDQKYLDGWPEKFRKVYVTQNQGEGVAPWNIQAWRKEDLHKMIFYHFHGIKLFGFYAYKGAYKFPSWSDSDIYLPYINVLQKIEDQLMQNFSTYVPSKPKQDLITWLRHVREGLRLKNNFLRIKS